MGRLEKLQQKIRNNPKIQALFLTNHHNINYLLGVCLFSSFNPAIALVTSQKTFLFVSPLILLQTKAVISSSLKIQILPLKPKTFFNQLKNILCFYNYKNLGFEKKNLGWHLYQNLQDKLKLNLIPTSNLVENLRIIKDSHEIKKIKEAIALTKKGFNFIEKKLKPGKNEKQIANELEFYLKKIGAQEMAFPPIVASGKNTSFPHYQTGRRKIKKNDLVLIDVGIKFNDYCSDLTQIFFIGKPKNEWLKIYQYVKEGQRKIFSLISSSSSNSPLKANKINNICHDYFKKRGYHFHHLPHAIGHGIGLEVHEKPVITSKNKQLLRKGMVFTIEPALYFPPYFGIRLEEIAIL